MTDLTDKILELNKEIKKEIEEYVKKQKEIIFRDRIYILDKGDKYSGDYLDVYQLKYENHKVYCIIDKYLKYRKVSLSDIPKSNYQIIYNALLDYCIKNS